MANKVIYFQDYKLQVAIAINIILLLVYAAIDLARSWNTTIHTGLPPGFCTAFSSVIHTGLLLLFALFLFVLGKKDVAQLVLRTSLVVLALGFGIGIALVGIAFLVSFW